MINGLSNLNDPGSVLQMNSIDWASPTMVQEFVPSNSRPCNIVAFGPPNSNRLLSGLDRVRNDYCLLIWDISRSLSSSADNPINRNNAVSSLSSLSASSRPISQFGGSESVSSAAWFPDAESKLVAGMGLKWIRIYDLRGLNL